MVHFLKIIRHIYPKVEVMKICCGSHSKKSSMQERKWMVLSILRKMAILICVTPKITASFILNELKKDSQFQARYHLGSNPSGQTQSSALWAVPVWWSSVQQEPNRLSGRDKKSLQMNPEKKAKMPMSKRIYRIGASTLSSLLGFLIQSELRQRQIANNRRSPPCPMSPNMMPNRKGKKATAKRPGLTSPQRGVPQVFTISWKMLVNQFSSKYVGGEPYGQTLQNLAEAVLGLLRWSCPRMLKSTVSCSLGHQKLPERIFFLAYSLLSQLQIRVQQQRTCLTQLSSEKPSRQSTGTMHYKRVFLSYQLVAASRCLESFRVQSTSYIFLENQAKLEGMLKVTASKDQQILFIFDLTVS